MTVTKLMQPTMPTGMSTDGFFTSSARVDTQSNPMKEKNTKEAPENIPWVLHIKCGLWGRARGGGGGVKVQLCGHTVKHDEGEEHKRSTREYSLDPAGHTTPSAKKRGKRVTSSTGGCLGLCDLWAYVMQRLQQHAHRSLHAVSHWFVPYPNGRKGVRFAVLPLENPAARMMMITTIWVPVMMMLNQEPGAAGGGGGEQGMRLVDGSRQWCSQDCRITPCRS